MSLVQRQFRRLDVSNDAELSCQEAGAEPELAKVFDEVAGNKVIAQQKCAGWVYVRRAGR